MRSKLTVALAVALLPLLASAELAAGTIELTGGSNLNFSTGEEKWTDRTPVGDFVEKHDLTNFDLDTGVLYYLTPNVGVGFELGYAREKDEILNETRTLSTTFIGPRVGLDLGLGEKISVFGDLALGFARVNDRFEDSLDPLSDWEDTYSGLGFRLAGGVKYFPVPALSFNAGLAYSYLTVTGDTAPGVETNLKKTDLGLNVGISVYLGR